MHSWMAEDEVQTQIAKWGSLNDEHNLQFSEAEKAPDHKLHES